MQEIFNEFDSLSDACRYFKLPINGYGLRKIKSMILENNIDTTHFTKGAKKQTKYQKEIRKCPVCGNEFEAVVNHKKYDKKTCSYSCSNTYFRSGSSNPNWKGNYRSVLKENHKMECVVCGENKIVAAHHYDENHFNNEPSNLIALCPTHHHYVHSKYKSEVIDKIEEYRKKFTINNTQ
jgi:hypothetical protein